MQEKQKEIVMPSTTIIPKRSSGSEDDPILDLSNRVREQICRALHSHILLDTLAIQGLLGYSDYQKSNIEGGALKVSKELLPDFYNLSEEVKRKLEFKEPIDIYIESNASINAYACASSSKDQPHIIIFNSALFSIMNEDELKFVLGHEIGHLMHQDHEMSAMFRYLYPDRKEYVLPISIENKMNLFNQLAELMADREGYYACQNLDACITAMYKISSGLDLIKMGVSIKALVEDNKKRLDFFVNENGISADTHPVNQIRIEAINLLSSGSPRKINSGMRELLSVLVRMGDGELDRYRAAFMASAGLILAQADGKTTEEELDVIIEKLSEVTIFATEYLKKMKQGDLVEIFNTSVDKIMEIAPGLSNRLFDYVIEIVFADKETPAEQLRFIIKLGHRLQMTDYEIAFHIANFIREKYTVRIR